MRSENSRKKIITGNTWQLTARILQKPSSLMIVGLTICLFLLLEIFADDIDFLTRIFKGDLPVDLFIASFGAFFSDFFTITPLFSLILLSSVALFAGIQLALFLYLLNHQGLLIIGGLLRSGLGMGALLLGLGCLACSSFFLSAFFTIGGIAFVTAFLPFGGVEFYLLSIALFLVGIRRTMYSLRVNNIC